MPSGRRRQEKSVSSGGILLVPSHMAGTWHYSVENPGFSLPAGYWPLGLGPPDLGFIQDSFQGVSKTGVCCCILSTCAVWMKFVNSPSRVFSPICIWTPQVTTGNICSSLLQMCGIFRQFYKHYFLLAASPKFNVLVWKLSFKPLYFSWLFPP